MELAGPGFPSSCALSVAAAGYASTNWTLMTGQRAGDLVQWVKLCVVKSAALSTIRSVYS